MCLTCELDTGNIVRLLLTQRLCLLLAPRLLDWLVTHNAGIPHPSSWQSSNQQAAIAALPASPGVVRNTEPELVNSVEIFSGPSLALCLKQDDVMLATLSLNAGTLRQWLGIVHALWQHARWPKVA